MPKTTPREETASVGSQKASVHLEKHAHSSMTRTRKAKGRDDPLHFLRQVHSTEIRKVTEKVTMTEVLKAHPALTGESPSGKANRHSCTNFKKGSCQRRVFCDCWQVPECTTFQISRTMQVRRQVCIQTHIGKPVDETRNPVSSANHIPSNDECNCGKFSRIARPNFRWRPHHHANKYVLEGENLGPTHGVIQTTPENQRNPNAPLDFELGRKSKENSLDFFTRTCIKFQVRILRIDKGSSNQVPRAVFLHLLLLRRKSENSLWTRELHFI